ncbi:MAG TPA: winged helix-turn-helix domain-containing protein [Candidatus Acidoferrales bacterium]|nr:winged helix-turn-helix domain-containing protein [Candidatus Acidoferrales bacterium]
MADGSQGFRFGTYEADPLARELRRHKTRIKLYGQPFAVLMLLLERAGEVVTREELRQKLWPADTYVDFEHGVNTAVKKLRQALSDSAGEPRFVETLPRVGYRFLAPVERIAPAKKQRVMLVVLPFENLSNDPEQEYFSDGLTEETITALGQLASSRHGVIARTSAMAYKRTRKSITEIGHELGIDYALEGSVRRDGTRVRISAQLVRASDQTHLWAQNYNRELKDFLSVQGELGRAIAAQVQIKLTPSSRPTAGARAVNAEAYDAYLHGRYHLNRATRPNIERAIEYFQQATEIDPCIAVAYAGLADAQVMLPLTSDAPSHQVMPKGKEAARRALEIDPELAEAHTAIAFANFWYDWDWANSEKRFCRALELNSNYSWARYRYAHLLSNIGRHDEALGVVDAARELDPLSLIINTMCSQFRYQAARLDEALALATRPLELDPNFWVAHLNLSKIYAAMQRYDEALAEAEKARVACGLSTEPLSLAGHAQARLGHRVEAEKALNELLAMRDARYVPPYNIARVYLGMGEHGKALEWLECAYAERDVRLAFLKVEPKWNPLRTDGRFKKLIRRVGFP